MITPQTSNLSTAVNLPSTPRASPLDTSAPNTCIKKEDEGEHSDSTISADNSDSGFDDDDEDSEDDEGESFRYYEVWDRKSRPTRDASGKLLDLTQPVPRLRGLWDAQDSLHPDHYLWLALAPEAELKKRGYYFDDFDRKPAKSTDMPDAPQQQQQKKKRSSSSERRAKDREENPAKVFCTHEGWCECPMGAGFEKGVRIPHLSEWALAKGFGVKKEVRTDRGTAGKGDGEKKGLGNGGNSGAGDGKDGITEGSKREKRKLEDGEDSETPTKGPKMMLVYEERSLGWE